MFPMLIPLGLLVGFGLYEVLKPKAPSQVQIVKGTTPTGVPVTTVIPVSPVPPTPVQAQPNTYVPPPRQTNATTPIVPLTSKGPNDTLLLAPILITPTGAQSASISSNQDVQNGLNALGFGKPPLVADGIWGPKTQAAATAFAASVGMAIPTSFTQALKDAVSVAVQKMASPNADTAAHPAVQAATVQSAAATVPIVTNKDIQHALNVLGATPPLVEDGILGPKSIAAVKAFQQSRGLKVDGIAGPMTKTAMQVAMTAAGVHGEKIPGVEHYHFDQVEQRSTTVSGDAVESKAGKGVRYGTKA